MDDSELRFFFPFPFSLSCAVGCRPPPLLGKQGGRKKKKRGREREIHFLVATLSFSLLTGLLPWKKKNTMGARRDGYFLSQITHGKNQLCLSLICTYTLRYQTSRQSQQKGHLTVLPHVASLFLPTPPRPSSTTFTVQ